jgi:hypothetical protein
MRTSKSQTGKRAVLDTWLGDCADDDVCGSFGLLGASSDGERTRDATLRNRTIERYVAKRKNRTYQSRNR